MEELLEYIEFRLKHLRGRDEWARIDELEAIQRRLMELNESKRVITTAE